MSAEHDESRAGEARLSGFEPVVTGAADRHREKPLSLRLGPLRQQVEEAAAELDIPVRRYILDAITEKLERR